MEEKVSVWKANLNNGVILGLIGIVYTLVVYFLDLTFKPWPGIIFLIITAVILFYMIRSYRNNYLHGYITYGQSLGAGVVLYLYYSIIAAIFTYILYRFIDTGLIEKSLAFTEQRMMDRGTPQQAIDSVMAFQRKIQVPGIVAPLSIVRNMIYGTILSLVVSIFTRKEGNPLVDAPVS
jgi:hypothetical protein